jgi:hypothetical protein
LRDWKVISSRPSGFAPERGSPYFSRAYPMANS